MKRKYNIFMRKSINLLLIILISSICVFFYFSLIINGQKDESILENKSLQKMPTFHFNEFINGKYQNDLEASIVDQMLFSEEIKSYMTKNKAQLVNNVQKDLLQLFNDEKQSNKKDDITKNEIKDRNIKYIPISNNVYYYGDSNYMVFKGRSLNDKTKEKINKIAKQYNENFKGIDSYFYFVNQSKSINFNTVSEDENQFLTYIKDKFQFKDETGLKVSSYEQYKNYFYQTDHHWNYKGSYQGYKDIIHMIYPKQKVLEPTQTKTYDVNYYGSNARTTSIYTNKEKFTVYKFNIPQHITRINQKKSSYGNEKMYDMNNYYTREGYNHYRAYYGGDFAEVEYDFKQPDKENLLVIAPSYSNPINELIASHFDKTYFIDLRHYQTEYGKKFNPKQYCKEHHIDKFVLMLSIDHLTNGNFELED